MSNQLLRNQSILYKYLPDKAVPVISRWIYQFDFKLKIKKSRSSKYGDYRPPFQSDNHQITINHNMNKYAFLITLVHEVAHLDNYNTYKNTVKPHGEEWKKSYKKLMQEFLTTDIFPEDVMEVLHKYMSNPAASSCSDIELLRVLRKYDQPSDTVFVEAINHGAVFYYNKRQFVRGEKIKKRFKCVETETKKVYLFNPLTEVDPTQ